MSFVAIGITRDSEPVDLAGGAELEVSFENAQERPGPSHSPQHVEWRAGCNYMGARARISGRELVTGPVTNTDMGCPPPLSRQDQWLSEFFSGDPSVRLEGVHLTLRNSGTAIRLTRRSP